MALQRSQRENPVPGPVHVSHATPLLQSRAVTQGQPK